MKGRIFMNQKTRKLTTIAMLAAMAYILMLVGRIPIVLFLKYDPKDVIITIGGFVFGPMISFLISLIVSLVEMFTVSETGIIGCIMNLISTCAFACTAAFVYKKKHTIKGAVLGLVLGVLVMTGIMLLWNWLITPLYMGVQREEVVKLLLPAFLPFNVLKGVLNTSITLILYKPIVNALRHMGFIERKEQTKRPGKIGIALVATLVLVTCIFIILVWKGII